MKKVSLLSILICMLFIQCDDDLNCDPIRNDYFNELKEAQGNTDLENSIKIKYYAEYPECFDCDSATRLYLERLKIAEDSGNSQEVERLKTTYFTERAACAQYKGLSGS